MKFYHKIYFIVSLLLLTVVVGCSGIDKTLKRGDAAMAIGEYCEAAALYRKVYTRVPAKEKEERGRVAYKMADAYRKHGNTARALAAYRNAARYGMGDTLTHYYIGELLRMNGEYKAAEKAYLQYLEKYPQDLPAKRGYLACKDAQDMKKRGWEQLDFLYIVDI